MTVIPGRFLTLCMVCLSISVLSAQDLTDKGFAAARSRYRRLSRRKPAADRLKALEPLKTCDTKESAEFLLDVILKDPYRDVALVAKSYLAGFEDDAVMQVLEEKAAGIARTKDRFDRWQLVLNVAAEKSPDKLEALCLGILNKKNNERTLIALEAIGASRRASSEALKVLSETAIDISQPYARRLTAALALARIPTKDSIDNLIAIGRTPGRIRDASAKGLAAITGTDKGTDMEEWAWWWKASRSRFKIDRQAVLSRTPQSVKLEGNTDSYKFQGVDIAGKRLLFIIDTSTTMGNFDPRTRRGFLDNIKSDLIRLIDGLDEEVSFNIILFSSSAMLWKKGLLHSATRDNREAAKEFMMRAVAEGSSQISMTLDEVMKQFAPKTVIETMILVSHNSDQKKEDMLWANLLRSRICEANFATRICIHTIGLKTKPGDETSSRETLFKGLARDSGGVHREAR